MEKLPRSRYSEEFKLQAVNMVIGERVGIPETARRLGLCSKTLANWVKRYRQSLKTIFFSTCLFQNGRSLCTIGRLRKTRLSRLIFRATAIPRITLCDIPFRAMFSPCWRQSSGQAILWRPERWPR
ncbi:MAG: transposase [Desulfovibrio sp.]|nr:transposase [Desulfovibrio sp.]